MEKGKQKDEMNESVYTSSDPGDLSTHDSCRPGSPCFMDTASPHPTRPVHLEP